MNRFFTLLCLLVFVPVQAQDSLSVLFIGNSYIYSNDLPGMLNSLTNSLGDEITYDSKVNGGFTFNNHLNDPQTHVKIKNKPWDFMVLQGQSQEPSFPYTQVNTNTLPQAVKLADSVYVNRYCSNVTYFMTWGRENGDQQWDSINTFYKMNDRLRLAYLRIRDSAQASVAPVGSAWRYVRDNEPSIQLYSRDGSHPSVAGTYLAACTFYASLFRKSPEGAAFTAGLDPVVAQFLQSAAASVVLDSLEFWKLRSNEDAAVASFTMTESNGTVQFTNFSWRSTDYFWDFGDGTNSTEENPTHTYLAVGNYTVALNAINECGAHSITKDLFINVADLDELTSGIEMKQTGPTTFTFVYQMRPTKLILMSANGQILNGNTAVVEWNSSSLELNLAGLAKGIYFLTLEDNGRCYQFKLLR